MVVIRTLLALALAALLLSCGTEASDTTISAPVAAGDGKGAELFNTNCALCHGRKGDLGMNGAKDLTMSTLTREQMIALVSNGKGAMMPYKNVLTPKQIEQVVDHARSLRKTQ
jgi:cytochrome c6